MKRLILIRHAKSNWDETSTPDKDRPLNARGRKSAEAVGVWLSENYPEVGEVLVSSAKRCQETWQAMSGSLQDGINPRVDDTLYLADENQMLKILRTATSDCVVMIVHMPGIGSLARALRRDPPPMHEMFKKYPTGAATVLDFRVGDWSEVQIGTGIFVDYVVPKVNA